MKRILAMVCLLAFMLAACSGVSITIDDIETAIQEKDAAFAFDDENKPVFSMIGAEDGWIGYFEEVKPVKVYKYKDNAAYNEAAKNYEMIKDWPKKGNFVLECSDPDIQEIFDGLG